MLRNRSGFTISELIVVLIIFAVVTALSIPRLHAATSSAGLRSARTQTAIYLAQAHALAVQRGREAWFVRNGNVVSVSVDSSGTQVENRNHFLAIASRVMRNVLVDHARARSALRRGGGAGTVALDEMMWIDQVDLDAVSDLDEALTKLEALDERKARIIEQRYFGGLSLEETASTLGLSLATVKRELRTARAWLASELKRGDGR